MEGLQIQEIIHTSPRLKHIMYNMHAMLKLCVQMTV